MDKSWMRTSRTKKQYINGVEAFIEYAVHNLQKMRNIDPRGNKQQLMMPCPCTTCLNHIEHKVEEVQFHLFRYKIDLSYTKWDKHGENDEKATTAQIPLNAKTEFLDDTDFNMDFGSEIPTDGPATTLPIKLLNLKGKYGASDKFFTELLGLLKKTLPAGNEMDNKELTVYPTCGISRWKVDNKTHKVYDNIPEKAWRTIDKKFLEIAKDLRNLRLGISADGVDVNSGTRHHSVWPVLSVIYNLPSWLWVDTYDASTKENFNLRAFMLWMINCYPALDTLCECPYSGFKGCVVCGKDTHCVRLSASSKQSYAGHRRYLPYNHPFKRQKKAFNGQQEFQLALNPLTGEQIYNEINVVQVRVTAVQVKIVLLMIFKENIPSEEIIRRDLHLEDVEGVECLPNSEIFKEIATMGFEKPPPKLTFYKAFFDPQWKFLIHTLIQCLSAKRTAWNEFSSTMASAFSQVSDVSTVYTNEDVEMPVDEEQPATTSAPSTSEPQDQPSTPHDSPKQEPTHSSPHDSPITGVNLPRSKEGSLQLAELMAFSSLGAEENASKQEGMISDIDADAEISFVDETQRMDDMIFDTTTDLVTTVSSLVTTDSVTITAVEPVSAAAKELTDNDMTMAEALAELKTSKPKVVTTVPILNSTTTLTTTKPKAKGITIQEPSVTHKIAVSFISSSKGKAIMIESEKPVELEEEDKRQEEASMAALAELYDAVQAQIDADQELAARMTLEEHEKYTVEERARMLAEFIKNRKKQLAVERAEAIRSKPPTKSQLRNLMMTYLKNTSRFTHAQLKHRDFEEIQGLYNKEKELVDTFVPIGSEEDERRIKDLNTKAEEESSNKDMDNTNKRKKRIRMKTSSKKQKTDADLKEEE
ncbi:putative transposase-associated domain-containing protein [Tanacetum coccineum]